MAVVMSSGQKLLDKVSDGALGAYPNFGMSMRFSVVVEGLEGSSHLGMWQSCRNLELRLNQEKIPQGGTSQADQWLPGKIEYPAVTLERPMDKKSSEQVQRWLQGYAKEWDSSGPHGGVQQSSSVIITLLDYQLYEVMKWKLENARPSKWTGPALSAADNKVAIETLVIEHSGFLDPKKPPKKAKLCEASGGGKKSVEFHFNPETLTLARDSTVSDPSGGGAKSNLTKLSLSSFSIPELTFDGPKTLADCEQLLEWCKEEDPKEGANAQQPELPELKFEWGDFVLSKKDPISVFLTKVTIVYKRFDTTGKPTRATVTLELMTSRPNKRDQQNPTSGGLAGRSGHMMVGGETLPGIALGTYGNPARWRAVAAANEVDDPLRVRPGSLLYLPSRAELAGGDTA